MSRAVKPNLRLKNSFGELMRELNEDVTEKTIYEKSDDSYEDMTNFSVWLRGPPGTPYAGGKFKLQIEVQKDYPHVAPVVTFKTPIYHPNVKNNSICLDILSTAWSPVITFTQLLSSISALLDHPNGDDPLSANVGKEFRDNYETFKKNAVEHTKKHAEKDSHRNYLM